ncbi:very short patch repair endonuclease [Prochlorococcus sp. AH-716-A06]|nr:very short patch repair endonuclease [Prochlorococcus sp. AH-716-A06]
MSSEVLHKVSEQRSRNMSAIKSKNTKPEIAVRKVLHSMGYRFRLHGKDLPGSPDIVLPKYKTVIFVHGCFWHRHENCKYASTPKTRQEFWNKKFKKNIERDLEIQENIKNILLLIRYVVIWECETKNIDNLTEKIIDVFNESIG